MSDLAPFVAAVLLDKSNAEMKQEIDSQRQEIDSLRQQLRAIRSVKITGPNGSPVYARAQLEDGVVYPHNLHKYLVPFPNPALLADADHLVHHPQHGDQGIFCSPRDLIEDFEVHIGGLGHNETIRSPYHTDPYDGDDNDTQFGSWKYHGNGSSALRSLAFNVGCFTSEAEFDRFDVLLNSNDDALRNTNSHGEHLAVYFAYASFDSSAVRGLIENFDQRLQQAQEERRQQQAQQEEAEANRQRSANVDDDIDDDDIDSDDADDDDDVDEDA